MEPIYKLIQKQAAYVKLQSATTTVKKTTEALATERMDKFSANEKAGRIRELDNHMKLYGWLCFHYNDKTGTRSYGRKDMPDYKIVIKGSTFSILNKGVVEVEGIHMKDPATLKLVNPGKFIKTKKP